MKMRPKPIFQSIQLQKQLAKKCGAHQFQSILRLRVMSERPHSMDAWLVDVASLVKMEKLLHEQSSI
jgi:hypothetical protein